MIDYYRIHDYLSGFRLFVFDVDDTLLPTFRTGYKKVCAAAEILNLKKIDFKQYQKAYGVLPFEKCIEHWFGKVDVNKFILTYNEMSDMFPYMPICDFSIIQRALASKNIDCAILTNGHNDLKLEKKLHIAGVDRLKLVGIWGREDVEEVKPSIKALKPLFDLSERNRILYIGDSHNDYIMCKNAGIGFLQVLSGKDERIDNCYYVKSIKDLVDIV